jgi:glycosyltransferase involved in cell wall biosynthesis
VTDAPRVTILTPAHNADATLSETVQSVLAQTVPQLELLVIDDGSDRPAAEVLAGIDDARLRVIRRPRRGGPAAARNTGLAAARGVLVSQLDADDLWEPEYLENVLPHFEDPAVGLTYTNATILGHPEGLDSYIVDTSVHPIDRFPKIAEVNPIGSLTATMRRGAVVGVGGYSTRLFGTEDYHLYLKLARAGWRFSFVDRKLARYRWPDAARGLSHDQRRREVEELKLFAMFAARHPLTPGPRRQVRVRVRRELRRLTGRR